MAVLCGLRRRKAAFDCAQLRVAVKYVLDRGDRERRRLLSHRRNAPVDRDLAVSVVRLKLPAQQREKARLAAAIGAGQPHPPARRDLQRSTFDQAARASGERKVSKLDHFRDRIFSHPVRRCPRIAPDRVRLSRFWPGVF